MVAIDVTFLNLLDESAVVVFYGQTRQILAGSSTIITGQWIGEGYSVPVAMIQSPSNAEFAEYLAAAVGIGSSQTLTIVRPWMQYPEQPLPAVPAQTSMWPLLILLVFGAYLFLGRKH